VAQAAAGSTGQTASRTSATTDREENAAMKIEIMEDLLGKLKEYLRESVDLSRSGVEAIASFFKWQFVPGHQTSSRCRTGRSTTEASSDGRPHPQQPTWRRIDRL
jgi:hypothetical protein